MRHSLRLSTVVLATATLTFAASSCGDDSNSQNGQTTVSGSASTASSRVSISDAWSRQPAAGQSVAAVYGVVTNDTDVAVTLSAASSSVTDRVELHETLTQDDGTMSMREVDAGFSIPAGGSFAFEPGGPHVMLLDIDAATYPTNDVDVTLVMDSGEQIAFTAEVRPLSADDEAGGMSDTGDTGDMDTDVSASGPVHDDVDASESSIATEE
jgi:periplasmic copper chaperone A